MIIKSETDGFVRLPAGGASDRTRALLKVEDGCVNFCSYCIIPYARGKVRSLPYAQAVDDAAKLQKAGYREIVITGIEISSYGEDLSGGENLITLIRGVCEAAPEARIGLGSLKPTAITDEFCQTLSEQVNLCHHFHLSLQSGCDKTLAGMNRKYKVSDIREAVNRIRRYFPDANITADIIVGFPGESSEDFSQTLGFLNELDLGDIHFFPYSRRKGTPAADMDGQVPKIEKEKRCAEAAHLKEKCKRHTYKKYIGTIQNVLLECNGYGYTSNYLYTYVEGSEKLESGKFYNVIIIGNTEKYLIARLNSM